jgi:putative transposase
MLSQFTRCGKKLCSCLSAVAKQLYRRITEPARSNLVTGTLADLPRSRAELLAENALLRQQLIVLHRRTKTPRLTWREWLSLLFLARWVPNWKQVLRIIKPDTLPRWHREGFRLFWRWKSHVHVQMQPQRLPPETIALIQRMARENLLRGAEWIRGEFLKLNFKVAKRTIQKYMRGVRSEPPTGQSWSTLLQTHGKGIWACDFVPVVTLFFKTIHAFVIVHHESRRVVRCGVTEHPTDEWMAQQLCEATPFAEKPKYLICDNDKKYGAVFERVAKTSGIKVIDTLYQAPRANAICERFVGSLRRECLDHILVLGVLQLVRILKDYIRYFNEPRPHQGIAQRTPAATGSPPVSAEGKGDCVPVEGNDEYVAEGGEGDCIPADRNDDCIADDEEGDCDPSVEQSAS